MKRFLAVSIAIFLSLIHIGNVSSAVNILQNPGFEALGWPPAYWAEWQGSESGSPGDGVAGYISNTVSHAGSQSAVRELYGTGARWGGYSQDANISEGESVTASGWLMSDDSDNPLKRGAEAYIELVFLDNAGNELALYKSASVTAASPWVQHSITQVAPAGAAKARLNFVLYGFGRRSVGKAYFDDGALVAAGADTTPPVVTITSPADQSTSTISPIIVAGIVDDPTVASIDVNGNIEPVTGGSWSSSVALAVGTNIITATATDGAGNAGSDSITLYYSPDITAPVVTILSPIDGSTVSAGVIPAAGTVDDLSIVTIDINGNAVPCYEGKWETNLSVAIGGNIITATAVDDANNAGTAAAAVIYDPNSSTALFDIVYPQDGAVSYETPALVTATLANPADLYININGTEYIAVEGAMIAHVPIAAGANTLELRAHDSTGYEEVRYLNITFDTSGTDLGGAIANNSFENSGYPQVDWIRWSGNQSFLPTDGSVSFVSDTMARTGLRSSGQQLFGGTIRWGGVSQEFPVTAGDTLNASGYAASFSADDPLSGGAEAYLEIKYVSNRGNEIEKHESNKITSATEAWVQLAVSSVVPDGAETAIFSFAQFGPDGSSGTAYFDDAYVEIIDGGYTPPPKNPFDKPQGAGSVQIAGNTLLVDGQPFSIKGVCYQPVPIGYHVTQYDIYSDPNIYNRDLPILRAMGANALRTYDKVTSTGFLDACYNGGVDPVYVVMGFYIDGWSDLSDPAVRSAIKSDFQTYVNTYKNHPAVLMWSPGNETESTYNTGSDRDYYTLINELAEIAYREEGSAYHPVTAVLENIYDIGDNGLLTTDDDMDYLDVWGGNVYEGITFGDMFDDFAHRSKKAFWVSEFGVDAWHTNDKFGDPADGYLDEASQAQWDTALWDEIAARNDVCSGGTVFEYSDEWWKDRYGDYSLHDYRGYPTGSQITAHPDEYSSEEWYGVAAVSDNGTGPDIVTIREAFTGLQSRWGGTPQPQPNMHIENISMSLLYTGPWAKAQAVISIYDENSQPVSGAAVQGSWSGLAHDSDSGQTDASGAVMFESDRVRNPSGGSQFTFTVTDVTLSGWAHDSASDVETSGSINIP